MSPHVNCWSCVTQDWLMKTDCIYTRKPRSSHLCFIEDAASIVRADHSKFAIQAKISCSDQVTSY